MWDEFTDHPMRRDYVPRRLRVRAHRARRVRSKGDEPASIDEVGDLAKAYAGSTAVRPKRQLMEISMGPHHPSTHGVFRMDVRLDGERVVRSSRCFGYLHRNHEKIAETCSYLGSIPTPTASTISAR
jgi:hypothetical protein